MKLFKNIISISILLLIFSCQKDIDEEIITKDTQNPTTSLTQSSIDNLKELILDADADIKYPITLLSFFTELQKTDSNEFKKDVDLFNYLNSLTDDSILITIKYPISYVDKENKEVVLGNNEELKEETETIFIPEIEDYLSDEVLIKIRSFLFGNLSFSYPINIAQTVEEQGKDLPLIRLSEIDTELRFRNLTFIQNQNSKIALRYPVVLFDVNKTQIVVENNQELVTVLDLKQGLNTQLLTDFVNYLKSESDIAYPIKINYNNGDNLRVSGVIRNDTGLIDLVDQSNDVENLDLLIKYPMLANNATIKTNEELNNFLKNQSNLPLDVELTTLDFIDYLNNKNGIKYPFNVRFDANEQKQQATIFDRNDFFDKVDTDLFENINFEIIYPITINEIVFNNNQEINTFLTIDINVTDRINYITRYDGRFDDVVDNSPNFSLEFPYQVMVGTEVIEINGANDYDKVAQEKTNQNTQTVTIINNNNVNFRSSYLTNSLPSSTTIQNLQTRFNDNISNEQRSVFSRYKIQFPIEIITDTNEGFYTVNDIASLFFNSQSIIDIKYPITLVDSTQNTLTISNHQELIETIESK